MESEEVNVYKEQLFQVKQALRICEEPQREELLTLKNNIEELLSLANLENDPEHSNQEPDTLSDEYELFMAEMAKEGIPTQNKNLVKITEGVSIELFQNIEGKKCRAPHTHQWGNTAYHNAMICSVFQEHDDIKARVLFINPTHKEMLPCPFYYESDCKFSDEQCHFSHGEIVLYSSIQDYIEPQFELLTIGSLVLAKQDNGLWYRAIVQKIYDSKCVVKFECNKKSDELSLEHIFPLDNDPNISDNDVNEDEAETYNEDVINMSLLIKPCNEALGGWEKYTKGIGSKLMQKMGYVVGTGLGKNAEGRLEPVTAVILPAGKSLDHCMRLKEQAGGDKNLFSVERKLKRMQKKQEKQNQQAYEQMCKKTDVFDFINNTLANTKADTSKKDRLRIKEESLRNLNIENLKIASNVKKIEENLGLLKSSLNRHEDRNSSTHQQLSSKILEQQDQLKMYQKQAQIIKNELNLRMDRKKMTEF